VWEKSPSVIKDLSNYYTRKGVSNVYISGEVKDKKERTEIIEKFKNDDTIKILFVSFLTNPDSWEIPSYKGCSKAILYSLPDRGVLYQQLQDRQYRINSLEPVTIYRILMKSTIDEWAVDLLDAKIKMASGFLSEREFKQIEEDSYSRILWSTKVSIH